MQAAIAATHRRRARSRHGARDHTPVLRQPAGAYADGRWTIRPGASQARHHRALPRETLNAKKERLDEIVVAGIDELTPATADQRAFGMTAHDWGGANGKLDLPLRPHLDQQISAREGEP
ncbi:MAG TPA: hypothetical protein VN805_00315 [Caulobacteraceae bacterium]|nr:hypothetical protein [Caulobacteraceae bacterium]